MSDERAHSIGDAPIEDAYRETMRALATVLDEVLNKDNKGTEKDTGFVLMVFPFADHQGRCNYVSNAKREDITVLLREQLARFEGRAPGVGKG